MPDLFGYLLTGNRVAEVSIASTTQLLEPVTKQWNMELIQSLGLPDRLFPELVKSGTVLGQFSQEVCEELAIPPKKVISVAGHDTACAVAAVPAGEKDFIFISCGTWSLFGTELDKPILTEKSSLYNLTNEVGYGDTTEFLNNIIGLWLIQETRRQFNREGKNYSYGDMEKLALKSKPFAYFIDPDNEAFVPPGDIPGRIKEYCKETGQGEPASDGEIIRCIYDSLAMKYNYTYQRICDCTGKEYSTIHMVGGGSKDNFLCQLTANTTGCEVLAGPVEATAFGNAAIQFMTLGLIPNIESARQIVKNSFTPVRYFPFEQQLHQKHFQKFKELIGK
jgi:rhamnulokinase/L-fuculokinase